MACKAPRMATTHSAARTAGRNTAVITTNEPMKRMAPISAVNMTATVPTMPDPVTDRPLFTDWKGDPVDRILLLAAIASAARPR